MSDTPRTDRDTHRYGDASVEWRGDLVPACACRIIERELNAANDRIKRLEEAGDALFELCDASPIQFELVDQIPQRLKAWEEAKEAKP